MSLSFLRQSKPLSTKEQVLLSLKLSWPAMLAQLSSVGMQYIDASMVGRLTSRESAAIGLVSSSTWLLGGLCFSAITGFSVLVAQRLGAGDDRAARSLMKQGVAVSLLVSLGFMVLGLLVSPFLPKWLGGEEELWRDASLYFAVVSLSLPANMLAGTATVMLQATGRMRMPGVINTLLCFFDVVFNCICIFPTRMVRLGSVSLKMYGLGLRVPGAALGTLLSYVVAAVPLLIWLFFVNPELKNRSGEHFRFHASQVALGLKLSLPIGIERFVLNGAQVVSTLIVSPLGPVALAANSFSVTAESLCYMPAYGIQEASTAIVGQCIGSGRRDLASRFAWVTTILGMGLMVFMGTLLYIFSDVMLRMITPDLQINSLGAHVLRIEAFAEPMFAASIIISGAMRGAGDTTGPSVLNLLSMWLVRIPLSALLAGPLGLSGVWVAMCIELNVRGLLFIVRLASGKWMKQAQQV